MNKKISILDCTLRDGGMALEGNENRSKNNFMFSDVMQRDIAKELTDAAIDIIELGTVRMEEDNKKGYSVFPSMEEISNLIPENKKADQLYAVFFPSPDITLNTLPDWNESLCNLIRFSVRYSELSKSMECCKKFCEKGYKVSIQPIVTIRYSDKELEYIVDAANDMDAYSVYFVDSYGSMNSDDIKRIFQKLDKGLKHEIKIGFHAHNNMGLASANVMSLLALSGDRQILIDSCCMGMGQGAGNLQTEVIVNYLNKSYGKKYNFQSVLRVCDLVSDFWTDNLWGYSVETMIPAVYNAAYRYGVALRKEYKYSYEAIDNALKNITDDMRYRYTNENLEKILKG